ncbi:cation:proton antiporter domain-containing protein [Streptomyces sp. 8N114]|uniref:cation:proton antiporter domain-containing protein n=1 Tax=Streptomyces sp. 8N114 TaxID=3457419 RepID=UPI003FD3B585
MPVTETQLAVLLADVALVLVVARMLGALARRLGQPAVIGEILGGILLGPSLFGGALATTLFPADVRPHLTTLADLGLVLFMFLVGLEFDFGRLRGSGRIAGATALGTTLLPFALGLALSAHLLRTHQPEHAGNQVGFALFVGIAVSVTAFPVLARIISDRGMQGSRTAALALSAAAVCDLAAWSALAAVQSLADGGRHWQVVLVVPYTLALIGVARPLLRRLLARARPGSPLPGSVLTAAFVGVLVSAAFTQLIGLHFVIGAFLFGLVMPRPEQPATRAAMLERTHGMAALLLPVYFVVAGLKVDLARLDTSDLVDLALVLLVAVTGKFAGTWLAARSQGLPSRESAVLATLMNTRGLTELIALGVGLQAGLIDERLYAVFVVMAVVTTAMAGPLLRRLLGPGDTGPSAEPPAASATATAATATAANRLGTADRQAATGTGKSLGRP